MEIEKEDEKPPDLKLNFELESEDLQSLLKKVTSFQLLSISEIKFICDKSKEILKKEPTILSLTPPITLVGDIHGQYQDLLEIFYQQGYPKDGISFVFIGDFVDRGLNSVEVLLLLLLFKIQYPSQVFLTRGNHESRLITQQYGFYDEILRKYGNLIVWQYFTEVFDVLPLGGLINSKIYCLHGGLSPSSQNLDEIKKVERYNDIPRAGLMCDMLWSDPEDRNGWAMNSRGAGYTWGMDISEEFLFLNNLKFVARAHQLVMRGYNWCHNKKVLSIFSAPNYCYRCGNEAAVIDIEDENNFCFKTYSAAPKDVYYKKRRKIKKGKERRDSADIDGEGVFEDEKENENDNNKDNETEDEENEIEDRINKVNEEYFHLKYELRYFV